MIGQQLEALERMKTRELRKKYAELFGAETKTGNRAWLLKRVAWRMQVGAEGDISERARQRARELANDADLRLGAPKKRETNASPAPIPKQRDPRLPEPGTVLVRQYKGRQLEVTVRADGFEYDGQVYRSLTALAKAITGAHWNGWLFFGLTKKNGRNT